EEALDPPSLPVGDLVVAVLVFAMAAGRDDGLAAFLQNGIMEAVGVVGAVGDDLTAGQPGDEAAGRRHVVLLAGADGEADGQAEGIDYGMELGAETAARAAQCLGFRPPFLRRAPAAWACALMTVASIASHSRSGSWVTASNRR